MNTSTIPMGFETVYLKESAVLSRENEPVVNRFPKRLWPCYWWEAALFRGNQVSETGIMILVEGRGHVKVFGGFSLELEAAQNVIVGVVAKGSVPADGEIAVANYFGVPILDQEEATSSVNKSIETIFKEYENGVRLARN